MITRDTDLEGRKSQVRRGALVAWSGIYNSWVVNVTVEIEGYGKLYKSGYPEFEEIQQHLDAAMSSAMGFVEGFYAN